MAKKRRYRFLVYFALFVVAVGAVAAYIGYGYYQMIYAPNVQLEGSKKYTYFYIPTGSNYEDFCHILKETNVLADFKAFDWVAKQKKYPELVKPGKYRIENGMSNNELVNMLRIGRQIPVYITFNNIRTKEQLAKRVSTEIEAEEAEVLELLNDKSYISKYGLNSESFLAMFIPNTYEFFWNTSADDFFKRMAQEYKHFWSEERKEKAKKAGLTQTEVSVLASIVQQETSKNDEKPRVAGVYINRLKKRMPLQADPTLIYALGDFSIKRVLNIHKEIDSPYNTYKYAGLPPGPITLPEISSLDAVLNYEHHDFLYFCAKPDFSGYHNFSKTYTQHLQYARMYHNELNRRRIMR